jgi:hypothetical protein
MKEQRNIKKQFKVFIKNANLDKYADKVLFKGKIKMANHILKTVELPKS